jgi:phage baseplate assembly protein W|tara:strand:+ start:539 stop:940 length:402 start_codon:yes stop_codon:yes gene_type:complete
VPVQRVSQSFKDISATFQINPLNRDLISLNNSYAIARSLRNLIMTVPGDRPFNPVLGSQVTNLLFEKLDKLTAVTIKSEIVNTIENFEPRVRLNEVIVNAQSDKNQFDVIIQYYIVGIDVQLQELTFALEPTR